MKQADFNDVIENMIDSSYELLVDKNSGYNTGEDKLHNFKVAANLQGVTTKQALAGMMAKHTTSVYDLCRSDDDVPMEVWNEKITDSINYLLLLKAVLEDERSAPTQSEVLFDYPEPMSAKDVVDAYYEHENSRGH